MINLSSLKTNNPFSTLNQVQSMNPGSVNVNHNKHFADFESMVENIPEKSIPLNNDFSKMTLGDSLGNRVMDSLGKVNQEIIYSDTIVNQMVTKPNSVDIHDVSIALQKADLSLNLTKSVIQRAITSYQTLMNLR